MKKKLLIWLLVLFIGMIYIPINVSANEQKIEKMIYVNPIYEDTIDEKQIEQLVTQQNQSNLLKRTGSSTNVYKRIEDAGKYLRSQFVSRNTKIYFEVESNLDNYKTVFNNIINNAFSHTKNPIEGDYIKYHYNGYIYYCSHYFDYEKNVYHYEYDLNMTYKTTYEQEKTMNQEVSKLINQLGLQNKNDYEKIKSIYDYMSENITYDYEHFGNSNYPLQYTAYAALINKTCVCLGYANLFYRLALEAGVDARIIRGKCETGSHAWNIVRLNNQYYNIDATWDEGWYPDYNWFLKSMDEFPDHIRDAEFDSRFDKDYPMSEYSYYIVKEDDEVSMNESSLIIKDYEKYQLKTYIDNIRVKPMIWKSSDTNIATIDKDGKITPLQPGKTIITATISNGNTAKCDLTVEGHDHIWNDEYTIDVPATTTSEGQKSIHCSVCDTTKEGTIVSIPKVVIPITSVKLNKTSVSVYKGKTYQLTATVSPTNTTNSKTIKWTSSNTKVVTVSSSGKVTGINYGKATITATTSNGKKATCSVTVPYTIIYKLNYGTNSKYNPSSYYGTKITLKNPTRKGYTFAGWYTDSKYKTRITSFSSGNKTVYAKWTKVTVSKAKTPTLTNLSGRKLKITYSATSGAKGYQIQYATNSKFSGATTKTLTGRSATYTLTKGKTYYVRVRAYKIDSTGAKVYGSWSSVKSKRLIK